MRRVGPCGSFLMVCAGLLAIAAASGAMAAGPAPDQFRVCADPNNLPFSDKAGNGFENKLAELVAHDLGKGDVTYTWWAQRRGFVRNTLKAGNCDVIMGVPARLDMVETTRPYYRSTYVFVARADRALDLQSMTDPRLKSLKIGIQLVGDDGFNTPPAHALGAQGIIDNVRGYSIYGDYRQASPPARIIEAVENGDIDVAAVWGPLAGYFAKSSSVPLSIRPITDTQRFAPIAFQFDIAMGVRKGDHAFKAELDDVIARRQADIRRLLQSYGVPLVAGEQKAADQNGDPK
jgi:mxaJ protein